MILCANIIIDRISNNIIRLFSATGLDPVGSSSAPSPPGQSIDLLSALGLHNGTWKGVTLARGPQQLRPAYQLQGNRTIQLKTNWMNRNNSVY